MTITEGRRLALELEQCCERVRLGLEAPPPTTFAALAERYLAEVASQKRSVEAIESRVRLPFRQV
jgi:hypothetical protein